MPIVGSVTATEEFVRVRAVRATGRNRTGDNEQENAVKIAIFSDVHANLPALECFVRSVQREVDAFVCLGDVVGFGPWNNECLELLHELSWFFAVDGNHETMFRNGAVAEGVPPIVRDFFEHSYAGFTRHDLIADWPAFIEIGSFRCTHTIDGRRIFADTPIDLDRDRFIGHSHQQFCTAHEGYRLINPGSIGQNRRHIDVMNFAIFDPRSGRVDLRELPSPIDIFIRELQSRRYPATCIDYYRSKPRAIQPATS